MTTQEKCEERLYMGMETSQKTWGLTFFSGRDRRQVQVEAWNVQMFEKAIRQARAKFGLSEDCVIRSCYEAGRDAFSIHRFLTDFGIENTVIDPASIEVKRQRLHKKTDRLDGLALARMLYRYHELGEKEVWSVVRVPSEESEDERRLTRELGRLKKEKNQHVSRIKALLATVGVATVKKVEECDLSDYVPASRPQLLGELQREQERLQLVRRQQKQLEDERAQRLAEPETHADEVAAKLMQLKAIGPVGAWDLSKELFGWRTFANRREVGAIAGLTGTPYDSGSKTREQGISKTGRPSVRALMVEMAWMWLRHQPDSELSRWYHERFDSSPKTDAKQNRRMRRVGIVALARKLLVALWKYVQFDQIPAGAVFTTPNKASNNGG